MRKSLGYVLAASLFCLPMSVSAQGGAPGGPGRGGMAMRNPAEVLLEHKSELKLTKEQAEKLEAIEKRAKEVQEKNEPLVKELRESNKSFRDMSDEERE